MGDAEHSSPAAADARSDVSELTSNPSVWEGHMPRKLKDLEWNFTAGPLRVTDCSRKHWSRLQATYRAVLPHTDGTVEEFTQRIPHTSDADLLRMVAKSGVAQPRKRFDAANARTGNTAVTKRPVHTPELRQRLEKMTVKPLPRRPTPEQDVKRGGRAPSAAAAPAATDDCSSIFSVTTAASRAAMSRASGAAALPPIGATSSRSSNVGSAAGSASRVSGQSKDGTAGSAVSVATRASTKRTASHAGSKATTAASRRSKAESIQSELREERLARERLEAEKARALQELDEVASRASQA